MEALETIVAGAPVAGAPVAGAPVAGARVAGAPVAGAPRGTARPPRLGFLGVGWIGRHRMHAVVRSGAGCVAAICDTSVPVAREVASEVGAVTVASCLDELLEQPLDGLVIATPSAMHASQAMAALERGIAVFCQKPLARTAAEAAAVVEAARRADRLLGVDLSYRETEGMRRIRELVAGGELGTVYAVDLVFHNAYGPDKPWFRDRTLSGGGCLMDLGIHLVDLALWTLDFPRVHGATGRLFAGGRPLAADAHTVEDYAVARIDLEGGATIQLSCSWNLPAGREAIIGATFYGTGAGASLANVNGSFYDFTAERFRGTSRELLASPPDDWGGRAAVAWAWRLAEGRGFDPAAERLVDVSAALDAVYAAGHGAAGVPPGAALPGRASLTAEGNAA